MELPCAPQKPRKEATRHLIPTETPRTKRHIPEHFVTHVKGTENSRSAASMRVSWAVGAFFQVSALGMTVLLKSGRSTANWRWGERAPWSPEYSGGQDLRRIRSLFVILFTSVRLFAGTSGRFPASFAVPASSRVR